jgi:iron complex outermembrane recepter protein
MLYGTVFYKDLKNFTRTAVVDVEYPIPGQGTQAFQYTALVNGESGTVKGFEIGGNTFFDFLPGALSGLGVQGNLTYVDSDAPGAVGTLANGIQVPTTLEGLSKWSYNIIGMYEKYGVTVRAAYNWRDDYLETISGNGTGAIPLYRQAYGQLDASISYDFSRNVSVTLDAVNLLRSRQETYQNIETNPRFYRLEDRRIGLSFRIRN